MKVQKLSAKGQNRASRQEHAQKWAWGGTGPWIVPPMNKNINLNSWNLTTSLICMKLNLSISTLCYFLPVLHYILNINIILSLPHLSFKIFSYLLFCRHIVWLQFKLPSNTEIIDIIIIIINSYNREINSHQIINKYDPLKQCMTLKSAILHNK